MRVANGDQLDVVGCVRVMLSIGSMIVQPDGKDRWSRIVVPLDFLVSRGLQGAILSLGQSGGYLVQTSEKNKSWLRLVRGDQEAWIPLDRKGGFTTDHWEDFLCFAEGIDCSPTMVKLGDIVCALSGNMKMQTGNLIESGEFVRGSTQ